MRYRAFAFRPMIIGALVLVGAATNEARAQDEVRLTDGGVLQGKIMKETESGIELKHATFGVIQIPRERIVKMGPYGTLGPLEPAREAAGSAATAPAVRPREGSGRTGSRLDRDYRPPTFERPELPAELRELEEAARLEAEMDSRPDLAALYEKLLRGDVLNEADAQVLFDLNERAELEPGSLTVLERKIVEALAGEASTGAENTAVEAAPMPPPELAGLVDMIHAKVAAVQSAAYRETYRVETPEGRIEIRYERHLAQPRLRAGQGEVIEHIEATQRGRAIRYFSNGETLWLLVRRGAGAGEAFVAESEGLSALSAEEQSRQARAFEAPRGLRIDHGPWQAAGYPPDVLARAGFALDPFSAVDISTLQLVREDDQAWVFSGKAATPVLEPGGTAEVTLDRQTGMVRQLTLSSDGVQAVVEISDVRLGEPAPAGTFLMPEPPAGEQFEVIGPPGSADEALMLVGAR